MTVEASPNYQIVEVEELIEEEVAIQEPAPKKEEVKDEESEEPEELEEEDQYVTMRRTLNQAEIESRLRDLQAPAQESLKLIKRKPALDIGDLLKEAEDEDVSLLKRRKR